MIEITVNKRKFKGVYRWEDITLRQFCDLAAIPFPEGFEAYIIADANFTTENIDHYVDEVLKLTDKQVNIDFPDYYRKVVKCLTNIPSKIVDNLETERINEIYMGFLHPFVVSLIAHIPLMYVKGNLVPYTPKSFKWFGLGWGFYKVPETVTINEQEIPLQREPVITFIEASDLFRGQKVSKDDVKRFALFMAIYCRKWGQKYKEEKSLARRELFMNVRMSLVWSVFFYTVRRMPESEKAIQLFTRLPKQIREDVERVRDYKHLVTTEF